MALHLVGTEQFRAQRRLMPDSSAQGRSSPQDRFQTRQFQKAEFAADFHYAIPFGDCCGEDGGLFAGKRSSSAAEVHMSAIIVMPWLSIL
jgi:hypothetical protein